MEIRRAIAADAPRLTELALASKAVHGYPPDFIEACKAELSVDPSDLLDESLLAWIVELDGQVAGYAGLSIRSEQAELEALFIDASFVGQGVGRVLWAVVCEASRTRGASTLEIQSDPHAQGFYEAMGATLIGETPSGSIPGRMLPQLRYALSKESDD